MAVHCLQNVSAPLTMPGAARDHTLLDIVRQCPAVPGLRLHDHELSVLGCHQLGGGGAGQLFHRGGNTRAAGGLRQYLAPEFPHLSAQGGLTPAVAPCEHHQH